MFDDWRTWENVSLKERAHLPPQSGIYVVADCENTIWYVGQAENLKFRWAGKSHHRYGQLARTNRKLAHRIYWKPVPLHQLDDQERSYIQQLKPELNGQKVRLYLPQEPQIFREIKRLIKVLNKPTKLFPDLRSVVLGEYLSEDGYRCLIFLIYANDFNLIYKSIHKRNATKIRQAWAMVDHYCGYDETQYSPYQLPTYHCFSWQFEFIEALDLYEYLEDMPSLRDSMISRVDLFGVTVQALNDVSRLSTANLPLTYSHSWLSDSPRLRGVAYLRFRQPNLLPFSGQA